MSRKPYPLLLAVLVLLGLLSGCSRTPASSDVPETTEPVILATTPPPGNPGDVTCKGSYTAEDFDPDAVVAAVGDHQLTNEQLQVWYAMAVAAYRQETWRDAAPDFSQPLDTQSCPIDDSVGSWEQYFLKQALNTWHNIQALTLYASDVPFVTEVAYEPNEANHETYMTGMPATEYLYGYHTLYEPNSMHQAYLDALPNTLEALAKEHGFTSLAEMAETMGVSEDTLLAAVQMYNYAYMYFTQMSYGSQATDEQLQVHMARNPDTSGEAEKTVDFHHILLLPEGTDETAWQLCVKEAETLLKNWEKDYKHSKGTFADLAYRNSQDTGTARDGGAYYQVRQGQLIDALDSWCFDDARQPGDTAVLQSELGVHIVYFSAASDTARDRAEEALTAEAQIQVILDACLRYPAEIDYSAITLTQAQSELSFSDVLYPDIAHERYPEIPLYLQQDYPNTQYGGYRITTNGCGITSMAMLASYMTDDELTPPEMCARYGLYSHKTGTDGMIFVYEPPVMGFYLKQSTYETAYAKAALEEGHVVISAQHAGYWTRGGHYIVLEKMNEDGTVQVRDSNIYNYGRISSHAQDCHTWGSISSAGSGYWIFEDKITTIPACSRCGDPDSIVEGLFTGDFHCRKCAPALLRRDTFLSACSE